jgi:hypothetical protein
MICWPVCFLTSMFIGQYIYWPVRLLASIFIGQYVYWLVHLLASMFISLQRRLFCLFIFYIDLLLIYFHVLPLVNFFWDIFTCANTVLMFFRRKLLVCFGMLSL